MTAEPPAEVVRPYVERRPGVRGGRPVIQGNRLRVSSIVQDHRRDLSVDEIVDIFPWLRPEEVYDTLSSYDDHRAQIDREFTELTDVEAAIRKHPSTLLPPGHDGD